MSHRPLMKIPEVAEHLGVSVQRAYELARRNLIPAVRIGRQVRVDANKLDEWIKRGGARQDSCLELQAPAVDPDDPSHPEESEARDGVY